LVIKHLKYKEIDFKKYDNCIDISINSRIYAYSWYLDIVCNKDWEVLILDDYKVVMPLPFKRVKRKFFKRMITQPLFCQQLGIFYSSEISEQIFDLFLTRFLSIPHFAYNFNSDNKKFLNKNSEFSERINYELNLNKSYDEIKNNFSKNLKRNIKKAVKNEIVITDNISVMQFIEMKKSNAKHKIKKEQYSTIKKLIEMVIKQNNGSFYGVVKDEKTIAIAFFIESKSRLIHLFSVSNNLGKKDGAIPFIFNEIIQKNTKNIIFDFEGSMIPGVAKFFESFGATNNSYFTINA